MARKLMGSHGRWGGYLRLDLHWVLDKFEKLCSIIVFIGIGRGCNLFNIDMFIVLILWAFI
jgi:hypothetical protein